jgi:hypothetical protein
MVALLKNKYGSAVLSSSVFFITITTYIKIELIVVDIIVLTFIKSYANP